jgi:hypothetical protein
MREGIVSRGQQTSHENYQEQNTVHPALQTDHGIAQSAQ